MTSITSSQPPIWIMFCLGCGIKGDDLVGEQRGLLVAMQEHAISRHSFTHEEFALQTRQDVLGAPAGAAYIWSRADGTPWLLAVERQQVTEDQIETLRTAHVRSGQPMRLVEVAYAIEYAGQRSWAIDSVAVPAGTLPDELAATAITQFWRDYAAQGPDAVASVQHVWLYTDNPAPDDSCESNGAAFTPQALDPALLSPKVTASCHTDDWAIDVGCEQGEGFDATPFFASSSDEALRDLIDCGFRSDRPADAVADLAEAYDERVAAMFAYLNLPGKAGFECWVNETQARAWLQCHRPHLLVSSDA